MQDCIDNLVKWSEQWGMVFNTEKCKIMLLEVETLNLIIP